MRGVRKGGHWWEGGREVWDEGVEVVAELQQ